MTSMHYSGSKATIARFIIRIMMQSKGGRTTYVEPFLGGANVMSEVPNTLHRIGSDHNHYLIALWQALQQGWQPPEFVTREEYYYAKENKDSLPPYLVAYIGFVCSFNSYWYDNYRGIVVRTRKSKSSIPIKENQQEYARNHLMKQVEKLANVDFMSSDYRGLEMEHNAIVFCDPPYYNTSYKYLPSDFDHREFWQWCRDITKTKDALVFVTECIAPNDFISVWQENTKTNPSSQYATTQPNRLFVHNSQAHLVDTSTPPLRKLRRL